MSSAATSSSAPSEVDASYVKKELSSNDTKAQLNPDAAVFETSLLISQVDSQEEEQAMPSPQPLSRQKPMAVTLAVNGNELFHDTGLSPHHGLPDHIKPEHLTKDELRSLVRQQLEYYFSRENLAGDTYLVSQMDSDQYVLIQIVANFNQMKKLTNDIELVKEAIKESAYLQMDDSSTKMRPNMKRCIVILREVPDTTTVQEVEELFSGEGCPKYISCEPAHNNFWYIQFESEEGAQRAYRYLREDIKTFKGKPIMARIKAKPIARPSTSFAPKNGVRQPNEAALPAPSFPYPVSPVYGSHQPYPFFPPTMVSQWAAGQHFFDPTMIPSLANNAYHAPHFKLNSHQGSRPYYNQPNRNRHQTRSYKEPDRSDKEASPPYRQRSHSTNGTSTSSSNNTSRSLSSTTTTSTTTTTSWRKSEDDYKRLSTRTRKRRGSSEDIRTSRSPVTPEPMRSKDDSFQINLTSSQFPPLPSANFKTTVLPLQSPTTRQDYNKVASSPPLSPPIAPSMPAKTTKPVEEPWRKDHDDVKKEETTDSKKTNEAKNNPKPPNAPSDPQNESVLLSEKMSYAQITQKKGLPKITPPVSSTVTSATSSAAAAAVTTTVAQS